MWSSPTFWPLACFALEPQTIALQESSAIVAHCELFKGGDSLFHLFCDLLVDCITEILYGALSLA